MTKTERLRAFEMRLDGMTWAQIAERIGYTPQTVSDDLRACLNSLPRQVSCCYPAIRDVISRRFDGSIRSFALHCGLPVNSVYYLISGRAVSPSRKVVDAVLAATGLTYEEAFQMEEI